MVHCKTVFLHRWAQDILNSARQCLFAFGAPGCPSPARFQYKHNPTLPPPAHVTLVSRQSKAENPSSFRCRIRHCHTVSSGKSRPGVRRRHQKGRGSLFLTLPPGRMVKVPGEVSAHVQCATKGYFLFLSTCWDHNEEVCWGPKPYILIQWLTEGPRHMSFERGSQWFWRTCWEPPQDRWVKRLISLALRFMFRSIWLLYSRQISQLC